MKTLIFTIGAALLSFGSAIAETNDSVSTSTTQVTVKEGDSTEVKSGALLVDNTKTAEEVIAIDSQIVEREQEIVAPLLPGKSSEEIIQDDARIIEGVNAKIYPLDFKKINGQTKPLKLANKRLIGSL
ncbi:MAG: hypothetical protein EOO48_07265 [Flavobacterium sp.]|nr:MAG: hypothetical protein EOO48_07265 [Flavobacterium sp.]